MIAQSTTAAIWTHLHMELWQFIRRRVPDDHLADDLLQEAFMRIHRNVGALRESDRLAAWVYQIARNVVYDHYRTARPTVPLAEFEPTSDQGMMEPVSECGGISWLNEIIALLPETYRFVVELAEVEKLPQQEVADRLGLSLSATKSRIQRGRSMLKDAFETCCTIERDSRGGVMACDPKPNQSVCGSCSSNRF